MEVLSGKPSVNGMANWKIPLHEMGFWVGNHRSKWKYMVELPVIHVWLPVFLVSCSKVVVLKRCIAKVCWSDVSSFGNICLFLVRSSSLFKCVWLPTRVACVAFDHMFCDWEWFWRDRGKLVSMFPNYPASVPKLHVILTCFQLISICPSKVWQMFGLDHVGSCNTSLAVCKYCISYPLLLLNAWSLLAKLEVLCTVVKSPYCSAQTCHITCRLQRQTPLV